MNEKTSQIQKTASTLFDLSEHTDVAYSHQIADLMVKKTGIEWTRMSTSDFTALPVSRFNTNQSLLAYMAEKFGPNFQIVELGAGFTPHYLNLKTKILKYIEVEFDVNSSLKKEIIGEIKPQSNDLIFISGDILNEKTWENIKDNLDPHYPVVIFSEGVIAQYFNAEQKEQISTFIKDLLKVQGSAFVLDDTLRNHPELHSNPTISEGMKRIMQQSGSNTYNAEFQTFDGEIERWKGLLPDVEVVTVEYIKSKPEMDFAVGSFKLIVCLQKPSEDLKSGLSELSLQNKNNRIWK